MQTSHIPIHQPIHQSASPSCQPYTNQSTNNQSHQYIPTTTKPHTTAETPSLREFNPRQRPAGLLPIHHQRTHHTSHQPIHQSISPTSHIPILQPIHQYISTISHIPPTNPTIHQCTHPTSHKPIHQPIHQSASPFCQPYINQSTSYQSHQYIQTKPHKRRKPPSLREFNPRQRPAGLPPIHHQRTHHTSYQPIHQSISPTSHIPQTNPPTNPPKI